VGETTPKEVDPSTTIGSHPTDSESWVNEPLLSTVISGVKFLKERLGKGFGDESVERDRVLIERARAYRAKQRGLGE
jgi:hypothetical protein